MAAAAGELPPGSLDAGSGGGGESGEVAAGSGEVAGGVGAAEGMEAAPLEAVRGARRRRPQPDAQGNPL